MEDLATSLDAVRLEERLQGATAEEYWLHFEIEEPLEKYPAKQHARRVRERLDVVEGLIYLPGAPARNIEDSDMPAPFRQRRYFYYLSGCNEASCQLAYDTKRDILTLFIPRINPDRVFWNGRGSTPAEALSKYDIDEVFYVDQVESWIHDWFLHYRYEGSQRLYLLHKEQIPPLRFPWPIDSTSLQPAINQCRMIKDDHEIKLIRKANDISSNAHKQVLANITRFHNEAQVEGLFMDVCISHQAKQQAYDPIAASGPNAGTLHYDANNEDFGDRQLMCLDAGCEFDLYASDITRTFPLSGSWPSKEAENIYKLVERMQEACIQKLAPGVRYLDLHVLAHQIAIDGLLRLGILHNGTREEIYKTGTSKAFFPHGLGHHVGLEVHDVGQRELMSLYKQPKNEKVPSLYPEDFHVPVYDKDMCMAPTDPQSPHLEEGNVVTVEPGIYFSAYALSHFYLPSPVHAKYINTEVLYRYFPVGGVRIEDNILITSKSHENLTTAPKGDDMLAIIRHQDTSSTLKSRERSVEAIEEPLRRAPGISRRVAEPLLKPVSRAATEPIMKTGTEISVHPAFQGHWPSRESLRPTQSTSNNKKGKAQQTGLHASSAPQHSHLPLCGVISANVEHIFMSWQNETRRSTTSPYLGIGIKTRLQKCQQCVVLSETVERLRKTLSRSAKTSPDTSPKLGSGSFEAPGTTNPLPKPLSSIPVRSEVPEMRQLTSLPSWNLADRTLRELPVPKYDIPPLSKVPTSSSFSAECGLDSEIRGKLAGKAVSLPQVKAQRRSVTFDSYPTTQPQLPSNYQEDGSALNDWYMTAQKKQLTPLLNDTAEPRRVTSNLPKPEPVSKWSFTNLPEYVYPQLLPRPEFHSSANQEASISPDALVRGSRSVAIERSNEREHYVHPTNSQRRPDAWPTLPNARQGPMIGTANSAEFASTPNILPASKSRQSMFVPPNTSALQEQELTRRRSMGGTLKSSMESRSIPPAQSPDDTLPPSAATAISRAQAIARWNDRVLTSKSNFTVDAASHQPYPGEVRQYNMQPSPRLENGTRAIYGRARPGGEELQGVDYPRW